MNPSVQFAARNVRLHELDLEAAELLAFLPVTLEGPLLRKTSLLKRWTHRYGVLKNNVLMLYKTDIHLHLATNGFEPARDRPMPEPMEAILLDGYHAALSKTKSSNGTVIKLTHPSGLSYKFCVPPSNSEIVSTPTAMQWIDIINKRSARVHLSQFRTLSILGKGGYGTVHKVQHVETGVVFAMKTITKGVEKRVPLDEFGIPVGGARKVALALHDRQVREQRNARYVAEERAAMEALHHPYLVNLQYAFQDSKNWYFVMDFCEGGELYKQSRNMPDHRFPESVVRVWAAELVTAIEFMHDHQFVHRDIKPENVLLSGDGHVHLADFGFAKNLRRADGRTGRSGTFCGTKYYIPPEMLSGDKSHALPVDWWALGVLVYELLVGNPPFKNRDRQELYRMILKDSVAFPAEVPISDEAKSLIVGLLTKEPHRRLGVRNISFQDATDAESRRSTIRSHPFFAGIDWAAVEAKQIPSGFVFPEPKPVAEGEKAKVVEPLREHTVVYGARLDGFSFVSDEFVKLVEPKADVIPPLPLVEQPSRGTLNSDGSTSSMSPRSFESDGGDPAMQLDVTLVVPPTRQGIAISPNMAAGRIKFFPSANAGAAAAEPVAAYDEFVKAQLVPNVAMSPAHQFVSAC